MDDSEIGVGLSMLVLFVYGWGEALWAHYVNGAIFCGGLAVMVIMVFIWDIKSHSSEQTVRAEAET